MARKGGGVGAGGILAGSGGTWGRDRCSLLAEYFVFNEDRREEEREVVGAGGGERVGEARCLVGGSAAKYSDSSSSGNGRGGKGGLSGGEGSWADTRLSGVLARDVVPVE